MRSTRPIAVAATLIALFAAACSGSDDDSDPSPTPTDSQSPTLNRPPGFGDSPLWDSQKAPQWIPGSHVVEFDDKIWMMVADADAEPHSGKVSAKVVAYDTDDPTQQVAESKPIEVAVPASDDDAVTGRIGQVGSEEMGPDLVVAPRKGSNRDDRLLWVYYTGDNSDSLTLHVRRLTPSEDGGSVSVSPSNTMAADTNPRWAWLGGDLMRYEGTGDSVQTFRWAGQWKRVKPPQRAKKRAYVASTFHDGSRKITIEPPEETHPLTRYQAKRGRVFVNGRLVNLPKQQSSSNGAPAGMRLAAVTSDGLALIDKTMEEGHIDVGGLTVYSFGDQESSSKDAIGVNVYADVDYTLFSPSHRYSHVVGEWVWDTKTGKLVNVGGNRVTALTDTTAYVYKDPDGKAAVRKNLFKGGTVDLPDGAGQHESVVDHTQGVRMPLFVTSSKYGLFPTQPEQIVTPTGTPTRLRLVPPAE